MLQSLSIENYALIDKTEVQWSKGFSVITGETGSGKSILLGALGLIQGNRADAKVLKDEGRKCIVEAVFDISDYQLKSFFENNELDYDDSCVIRREVAANGKSRAFVNDSPVALSVMKELTSYLIDIHSQHETLLLNQDSFQMHVLDALADTKNLLSDYSSLYKKYCSSQKQLVDLKRMLETQNANRDYLEFQLKQLTEADFKVDEQLELEKEAEMLSHTTELKEALEKAQWLLSEKEDAICGSLKDTSDAIGSVATVYTSLSPLADRLKSSLIELKDIAREIESSLADVTVDPQRLEYINTRLDLIYTLEKKHKVGSLTELLQLQSSFEEQLSQIDSSSERLDELQKEIDSLQLQLEQIASQLSEKRQLAKESMEISICDILHSLGMQNAKFEVRLEKLSVLNSTGKDSVCFLFSANKNAALQPISSVASGGELSRVMLALKSILSKSENLPTIILDEIDTGVSGEVADRMGDLMKMMGEYMQVISITHLPQIASKGLSHYKVYKEDNEETTVSHIKTLTEEERVQEIAQMLSGATPSVAAIENARDLLGLH